MAKILVLTFTNMPGGLLDAFRQGFVEALAREGNEVLVLRSNDFLADHQNSNRLAAEIDEAPLLGYIRDFKPEAVFSMNHSGMFAGLEKAVECPIGIWLLDGPSYLVEPDECRRQNSRYQMFMPVRAFRQDLSDGFGFRDENLHYLPFATDFEAKQSLFARNIAFVGTFFTGWRLQRIIEEKLDDRELIGRIRRLIDSYTSDRDTLFSERLSRYGLESTFTDDFDEAYVLNTIAINRRIQILNAVQDLGLTVYGTSDWPSVMPFSSGLALSFDPTQVTSRQSLEEIYNSSKLNINVSHAQARGGLPWRIFDVMACNGVLISDEQEDLHLLFGSDAKIPIYESAAEARDLCMQLLTDESRRAELAKSCQAAIDKGHRFEHRIETISDILGLNLRPGGHGSFRFMDPASFTKPGEDETSHFPFANVHNREFEAISLQLFQSNGLAFDPQHSQIAHIAAGQGEALQHSFVVPDSLPYMRLDVGEYFSKHRAVAVTVAQLKEMNSQDEPAHAIDLSSDVIISNQLFWNGEYLACGFDAYCVFKNPFAGVNVVVTFKSTIEERI